ncbi:uncharacterized protein LOC135384254 [Ornithodoros turicata]|uniref:uncharacterized protein LOC135384254 n=1 Tax=Ornithodoros turicata TaxID=34597 RepID=UPI003138A2D6
MHPVADDAELSRIAIKRDKTLAKTSRAPEAHIQQPSSANGRMTLSPEKCIFGVDTIDFLGNTISKDGVCPNGRALAAIKNIAAPTSKTELRRLLGLATYLGRFVPRMADLLAPLTLMLSKRRYAQIEKEGLALAWACEKFQEYLIGKEFRLETDHKPLVGILSTKFLDELTLRLQRIRMSLMRYSYTVAYVPSKEQVAADALSRNPLRYAGPSTLEQELHGYVNLLEKTLPTSTSLKAIATEQTKDRTCQTLVRFSTQGWPSRRDLNPELKDFWEYRDAIAFENSLLMYKGRIVVPLSYQKYILQQIHLGHQGIVKCKARARDSVWWPGIGHDIGTLLPCQQLPCV